MSSIGEHTDASGSEEEFGRTRDGERGSPLSGLVDTSTDPGTRTVLSRASVMAAGEAPLEYDSEGRTINDRESAKWGSAGETEAIELSDRDRLQIGAQRGDTFGLEYTTEGADWRSRATDNGTARTTDLPSDNVAAAMGWNQWSTGDMFSPVMNHTETSVAFGEVRLKIS